MEYIDGFLAAVPNDNKEDYIRFAKEAAAVFMDHGAIRVVECWGDDVPEGELTSFPKAVQCKEDETVVFSWVAWPSREARDEGNEKVMADPRSPLPKNSAGPFASRSRGATRAATTASQVA